MVYRIYVEKKEGLASEALALCNEIKDILRIKSLESVRIFNRYDVENISEELFDLCKFTVFAEPQLDNISCSLDDISGYKALAVEYLPGQFDQRADSAAQCIQIISQGERPRVRTAKIYLFSGSLNESEFSVIKNHIINPVESREASFEKFDTLQMQYDIPTDVETLDGFLQLDEKGLEGFVNEYGLAMDADDIKFCQNYFKSENRCPTITEIRMIDTYWSDHCRHTTFLTSIDSVEFEDDELKSAYKDYLSVRDELNRTKSICLMDIATLAAKYLDKKGLLPNLDESEEINACTVKIKIKVDGKDEDWLLLFKNETHNHPTEIEPFGGAATCIGGAIRDPLSGRAYVYAAMRVTGAANPLLPVEKTIKGKLPQRKIVTTAAAGYSSYGNQIGLATGQVDEIYHDGYAAKRMEIGAVIAATPAANVRRERPQAGDVVILLGGKTGRDGCGGATGSSKSHTSKSLYSCSAEVQKGNAPEERKLQRLFRNPEASLLIKRCNDFGAGGVSVAVGELADGLEINLNAVPKKYDGLDGTELAISESQERMAVVVQACDAEKFIRLAESENLEAVVVAKVTANNRLVMKWNGVNIVNISREFLNSNGAEKHINIAPDAPKPYKKQYDTSFTDNFTNLASDLNICSKRGLSERFDSTIGAGSVFMPFGGKHQLTPVQAMVNKISLEKKNTDACSFMSWGFNPFISEKSPFHGAYLAVVESISKLIASGASLQDTYLTFQEYFERPNKDKKRWGKPFAALLGAFKAQRELKIASIGGKDSMSGTFENIDVPPTLVSFAITTDTVSDCVSPEFKGAGHKVVLIKPAYDVNGIPETKSLLSVFAAVTKLMRDGKVLAAYTPTYGGVAEAVMKMCFGNGIGFDFADVDFDDIFGYRYGSFVLELSADDADFSINGADTITLGHTVEQYVLSYKQELISLSELLDIYENKLEPIYPCNIKQNEGEIEKLSYSVSQYDNIAIKIAKPKVLIPVFPGTNCEYDSARAFDAAGAQSEIIVIRNMTSSDIASSVEYFKNRLAQSQIVFIPGGFSGGDEPDGSGKFITAFFRNEAIKEQVHELLKNRDGLICGICNGFQALIKLGLVPCGEILNTDINSPTLTFNTIGRHQSRLVRTRIASNKSPWLMNTKVGDIHTVPVSHGEGRFYADKQLIERLAENGQIATQYVDLNGEPTFDIHYNPNNSAYAIEGITSPDGRVFGKMGHTERCVQGLYRNVDGNYNNILFSNAVEYYK